MDTLEDAVARNPHLADYLSRWAAAGKPAPRFYPSVSRDLKSVKPLNLIYPVGDPIFVHLVVEPEGLFPRYYAVEPRLLAEDEATYEALRTQVFLRAPEVPVPESGEEYRQSLEDLLSRIAKGGRVTVSRGLRGKSLPLPPVLLQKLRYILFRDVVEHGPLEPVMRDPWIEDISGLGVRNVHVVHKIVGTVETNISWPDVRSVDAYLETMTERMGRPVSDSNPIVDGALPNGSRINVIYSDAISKGGSSFTIRKFSDTPLPVTQIVQWNTMSARLAAYLWLCLENGMSVFVAGETASGKTTSLNAILPFIKPKSKILTAEDTPEVLPPHANWQQLITRDRGNPEARVTMYDLLKAALRSRPNYVIVGEIRGAEGAVAFQAMQTGHPTMATFHASSVAKLIQRFSSDPINVPLPFMDNLNVALIQMAVYVKGKMLRRVLAVEEIEGYSKRTKTVITRQVFNWDPVADKYLFSGRNNSYVLENLIAEKMGFSDRRDIYKELDKRTAILEELVRRKEFDYHKMAKLFADYAEKGDCVLPFPIEQVVPAR
ncbi:MAG: type II/IV secretion system ATPase subunit [Methanobacteriota archaeon]